MKKNFLILFILLLISSIFTSCQTKKAIMRVKDEQKIQSVTIEDTTITLKYLTKEELIERHGFKFNPFLAPFRAITPKKILVFEMSAFSTEDTVSNFDLDRIYMNFFNKQVHAKNKFLFTEYWNSSRDKKDTIRKRKRIIKDYLTPNKFKVSKGANYKSYIVFLSQFPSFGKAEITLIGLSNIGELLGEFKFNYDFLNY